MKCIYIVKVKKKVFFICKTHFFSDKKYIQCYKNSSSKTFIMFTRYNDNNNNNQTTAII